MPTEAELRRQQEADIAGRTRTAEDVGWRAAMRRRDAPATGPTNPSYAVEGLQGNIAARMREQGNAASARPPTYPQPYSPGVFSAGLLRSYDEGGTVTETGPAQAQKGEQVLPPPLRVAAPPPKVTQENPHKFKASIGGGGGGPNPFLSQMQANVESGSMPLSSVEGFAHGGKVPYTGIFQLHRGERVLPKGLAARYRQMKHG